MPGVQMHIGSTESSESTGHVQRYPSVRILYLIHALLIVPYNPAIKIPDANVHVQMPLTKAYLDVLTNSSH